MDGILNVLKPPGMTSHDVVAFIRRNLKEKKVGHTGTLDPGVTGVLPICLGKGTKIAQFLTDDVKVYRGEMTLGKVTSTQDSFGEIIEEKSPVNISEDQIREAAKSLIGIINQIPPMVSAVKHKGKRLYELAREGIEVERKVRQIEIFDIKIISITDIGTEGPKVLMEIRCSKGTYIRTLFHDIGQKLGVGAYMSSLVRLETGPFDIETAVTLDEILSAKENNTLEDLIHPIDFALKKLPKITVKEQVVKGVTHGNPVFLPGVFQADKDIAEGQLVRIYSPDGEILAIGKAKLNPEKEDKQLYFQPEKVF